MGCIQTISKLYTGGQSKDTCFIVFKVNKRLLHIITFCFLNENKSTGTEYFVYRTEHVRCSSSILTYEATKFYRQFSVVIRSSVCVAFNLWNSQYILPYMILFKCLISFHMRKSAYNKKKVTNLNTHSIIPTRPEQ